MNASRNRPVGSLRSVTFTPGRVIRNVSWLMFFRIWFLYLCKVGLLGFALVAVGFATAGHWRLGSLLHRVGLAMVVPLGIAGALITVMLLVRKRLACPVCGNTGEFVMYAKKPAIECNRCGLVYCKHLWLSFKLRIESLEDCDPDDDAR